MARLVTKFKFLKPGDRKGAGGYAKYIATREGVERIDDSQRLAPATKQQEKLIEKILKDFPDSKSLLEYADYQSEPNMGNASEPMRTILPPALAPSGSVPMVCSQMTVCGCSSKKFLRT